MNSTEANEFAQSWLAAWNGHDLDAVLAHVADDAAGVSGVRNA